MAKSDNIESKRMVEVDPIEAIFELNMGDFLTEHLISDELLEKINASNHDKNDGIKNQLKELVSIYSIDNTLNLLGFNNEEDFVLYNSISKTTAQMLDVDACQIFLIENCTSMFGDENTLILVGSSNSDAHDLFDKKIKIDINEQSLLTTAFNENRTILIENISQNPDWKPIKELNQDKAKTVLLVPMTSNSGKVGVVCIECYTKKKIIDEFVHLLEGTARVFVTSMNLQKLVEETNLALDDEEVTGMELRHLRTELTSIIGDLSDEQQAFVETLADAVDAKSHYGKEHSAKVAEVAREICDYLQLNEKTKDLIYYAGLLQNIGKITLPEELFTKKQKLSQEDWNKLQNHPNVGVNLLMKINFLAEVVPYIHYHKELWNGKGMPEGLSGNSIPLGSRIIAVADAYQALVTKRPYRDPIPNEKALEILKEEAGTKWDPIIVDALIEIKK